MHRKAVTAEAPSNGEPLYLGYQSTEVWIARVQTAAYFHFVTQPPHGDGLFQLMIRNVVLDGYIWGVNTFWAPNGRYLAAEWTGADISTLERKMIFVDLVNWKYLDCGEFRIEAINDDGVSTRDIGGNAGFMGFHERQGWKQPGSS